MTLLVEINFIFLSDLLANIEARKEYHAFDQKRALCLTFPEAVILTMTLGRLSTCTLVFLSTAEKLHQTYGV